MQATIQIDFDETVLSCGEVEKLLEQFEDEDLQVMRIDFSDNK